MWWSRGLDASDAQLPPEKPENAFPAGVNGWDQENEPARCVGTQMLIPKKLWLRAVDLNRRPLGYEGKSARYSERPAAQLARNLLVLSLIQAL